MVKKRFRLLIAAFTLIMFVTFTGVASAQERVYYFEHEWTKIWINQDGTIDLLYDVNLVLDSGSNINYILIGQPKGDFTIGEAFDQYGHPLTTSDASSGSDYKVKITFTQPLTAGQAIRFNITTNVAGLLYNDTMNPGNLGMQFIPTWWEQAVVNDLRIQIILPPNVTASEVKTTQTAYWNSTSYEDGRLAIYWEKQNLAPNEQYPIGVSFPAKYLPDYKVQPPPSAGFFESYGFAFIGAAFAILAIGVAVYFARKKPYLTPRVSMETLGIRRGLTAVEASYLLDMKPTQIVTEMLYSMLQKRAVWIESTNPSLKLRIMPQFQDKTGTVENPLRYYEIDFLDAVKNDGALDEEKLAHTVMYLRDTVEQKLRGYSRRDTVDYYRKIVDKAWAQVEQAGTVDLASKAYDEQLLWLLLDPNYRTRTETAFRDRTFEPSPLWFWYWYGYHHYHPNPTYTPNINTPTQAAKPPTIPGAEFANNMATAVEKTSSNIVLNIEKFANAIIPAPPPAKASHEPARHGADCVCACAACACACACVSCACACAGGGVG
jgi:hypothetical protein